jgi:hypothetical protein
MALANVALTDTFDTWRVRTNQIIVALDQANTATYSGINTTTQGYVKANSANVLAYNTSIGANNWANTVGTSGNSYAVAVTSYANSYANVVGTRSNTFATLVGTSANSYLSSLLSTVGAASNTYAALVGTSANSYSVTSAATVGAASNTFAGTVGVNANNYALTVLGYANNYSNTVGTRSNTWASYVGSSANLYANYVGVSSNGFSTVVGAAANTISNSKLANTDGVTFAGSIYFTTNAKVYTGTGASSLYVVNNTINSGYNYNADDGTLGLNYTGFNSGSTHFRSLYVYDGKTNPVAIFAGSDKSLYVYGDVQAYYASDISLKNNITIITDPLTKVNSIRGVEFDWSDEYLATRGGEDSYFIRKHDVGVIANEIEKVLPEAVGVREDGIKAVKYERIVPLLIEAIKELSREIEELKKGK